MKENILEAEVKALAEEKPKDKRHQEHTQKRRDGSIAKNTIEVCRYCGQQTPHKGRCKARGVTCKKVSKEEPLCSGMSVETIQSPTDTRKQ